MVFQKVAGFLTYNRRPESKAPELLAGLARKMGTIYRKTVHTPLIAEHLDMQYVEQLRPVLIPRLDPAAGSDR